MKRVCILTSAHPHTDTRIFIKECCTIASAGYETHFVSPGAPDEVKSCVHLHGIKKTNGSLLSRIYKTVWEVYPRARGIDAELYHFHDPELLPVSILLKKLGKKVIYDVHEDFPRLFCTKYWIPKPIRQPLERVCNLFENIAAMQFDGVITATPFIYERFKRLGCHAIAVNNYPILDELWLSDVDCSQKQRAVCYVGGISIARGILEMIEGVGQTNATLLLMGEFSSESLRSQVFSMPGWASVKEFGQLDRTGVAQIMSKSMAGLVLFHPYPNHVNAQPNKMFEYMSAGIPVIASNFPLWNEIVEGNRCGICVDPLDPVAISQAIQWIVDHPDEGRQMGKNGRKAVKEKYNWEKEGKKLLNLYQQLFIL